MTHAPEYVLARRVLLDAFEALGPQRDAVVLVGAQAIYLQVGDADLAVAVMTTDGDLALDPGRLHDLPLVARRWWPRASSHRSRARGAALVTWRST